MRLTTTTAPDPDTGEVHVQTRRVLPSHFKCPQTGAVLPVENPEIWVYHDASVQ